MHASHDAALPRVRGRIIPREFFARDTEVVARELLGAQLHVRSPDGDTTGVIVETEAYVGEHDPACHAAAGRTARTAGLYGQPGTAYVYFIYGMYWCFNAVTREVDSPGAVLVRAIQPLRGEPIMQRRRGPRASGVSLCNGPGKLCIALGIDSVSNGLALQRGAVTLRHGVQIGDEEVAVTPRIGISRAVDWPLRYFLRDNPWVSKTPRSFPIRQYDHQPHFGPRCTDSVK